MMRLEREVALACPCPVSPVEVSLSLPEDVEIIHYPAIPSCASVILRVRENAEYCQLWCRKKPSPSPASWLVGGGRGHSPGVRGPDRLNILSDLLPFSEMHCSLVQAQCLMPEKGKVLVPHSYPTLQDPIACSLPGSSIHEILQARILEGRTHSLLQGSSQPRDWTQVSHITGRF